MWKILMRTWNEAEHIYNAINSVKRSVGQIIVLDGAYRYFPYNQSLVYNKPYSTDGTLEIVKKLQEELGERLILFEHKQPFACEYQIMGKMLRECGEDGDFLVLLDGHELMGGNFLKQMANFEQREGDIGDMSICYTKLHDSSILPEKYYPVSGKRILRWHSRIHLRKTHFNFFYPYHPKILKCYFAFIYHYKRNKEREFLNEIHREHLKRFFYDEVKILRHRRKHKIPNGYVDIVIPERGFDPHVESFFTSVE